jgi:hypothetical protein
MAARRLSIFHRLQNQQILVIGPLAESKHSRSIPLIYRRNFWIGSKPFGAGIFAAASCFVGVKHRIVAAVGPPFLEL